MLISEMKKVIIVLYLAPTGLVSGGPNRLFSLCYWRKWSSHVKIVPHVCS